MKISTHLFTLATVVAAVLGVSACGSKAPNNPTATVSSIAVSGTSAAAVGQTAQLTATATMSDNTTQNVTSTSAWAPATGNIATVSGTGLVTAIAAGTAAITASKDGRTSNPFTFTVTAAPVQTVTVDFTVTQQEGFGLGAEQCGIAQVTGESNNVLRCKFSAVVVPANTVVTKYEWSLPDSNTVFVPTISVLDFGQKIPCGAGNFSGASGAAVRNVRLRITVGGVVQPDKDKAVTFVRASAC